MRGNIPEGIFFGNGAGIASEEAELSCWQRGVWDALGRGAIYLRNGQKPACLTRESLCQ